MMLKGTPDTLEIRDRKIPFPSKYSEELKNFIYFCLVRIPEERPNIS